MGVLDRKVAFVSGGTGALGRAVSQAFVEAGARVVATYVVDQEAAAMQGMLPADRFELVKVDLTRAADVAAIVADMLAQENHIVAAMGISDGTTDFKKVFRSMGISDRWILTPGNSASEIRRAFQVFSRSAVRATQGAMLGGFSN